MSPNNRNANGVCANDVLRFDVAPTPLALNNQADRPLRRMRPITHRTKSMINSKTFLPRMKHGSGNDLRLPKSSGESVETPPADG